ncbi:MAG: acyltransferase [Gemmatimonadota bacterium]|nr:acyltransferase [Gemmatimonadota bacterium]
MPHRPLRQLTLPPDAERVYDRWLGELQGRLADPACDRNRLCRDVLCELYYPGRGDWDTLLHDPRTPIGTRAALLALDPRNITLEPEHYHEIDPERYARVKPLLWLWQGFDRSPLGGGNVTVGVRFRRVLAPHVFRRCGRNFKCFQFVEFSFGYNMEVGDDVVVHRHVLLDDRETIALGDRVSIADYANVYTHSHDLVDQETVSATPIRLGRGVRVTYHATLLEGVEVGEQGMVGALAVATKSVKPYHVHLGIPAVPKLVKPNAPPPWGTAPA